jgi:hypothetical protein
LDVRRAKLNGVIGSVPAVPGTRFATHGDLLLVAAWTSLDIYRVTGASVQQISAVPTTGAADVVVEGNYAYVANHSDGVLVVDLFTPEDPRVVSQVALPGMADSLTKSGDWLFVGTRAGSVQVVDVAMPELPMVRSVVSLPEGIKDITAGSGLLMVSGVSKTVRIYSLTDDLEKGGLTAQLMSSIIAADQTKEMSFHGSVLYLRDIKGGLEAVDLRAPRDPRKISTTLKSELEVTSQSGAGWVAVDGDTLGITVRTVSALDEYER